MIDYCECEHTTTVEKNGFKYCANCGGILHEEVVRLSETYFDETWWKIIREYLGEW